MRDKPTVDRQASKNFTHMMHVVSDVAAGVSESRSDRLSQVRADEEAAGASMCLPDIGLLIYCGLLSVDTTMMTHSERVTESITLTRPTLAIVGARNCAVAHA